MLSRAGSGRYRRQDLTHHLHFEKVSDVDSRDICKGYAPKGAKDL